MFIFYNIDCVILYNNLNKMNKKLSILLGSAIIWASSITAPMLATAQGGFGQQRWTSIWVAGNDMWGGSGSEWFLDFIQTALNRILGLLGLITIILLIWGGFQMVTAAGDDGKYKKWFTIVKQAAIGLILIGVSALIVSLIFNFVNTNTTTGGGTAG